jgi:hypothetical protein
MSTATKKSGPDENLGTADNEYYINGKFVGVGGIDKELFINLKTAVGQVCGVAISLNG